MSAEPSPFRVTLPMVVRGAAVGAVAYLVGYAVTYLTAVDAARATATAFQPLASAGGRSPPRGRSPGGRSTTPTSSAPPSPAGRWTSSR